MKNSRFTGSGKIRQAFVNTAMAAALLGAFAFGGCSNADSAMQASIGDVPDELRVDGAPIAVVHATGFQIYTCTADASGKLGWTLKAPDAVFQNDSGLTGKHYAGPTWAANDGSVVTGRKLKDHASATTDAVPWLLLEAADHGGNGLLSQATFIQRIHTVGGKAPAIADSKAGDEIRVAYSADYVFYGTGAHAGSSH